MNETNKEDAEEVVVTEISSERGKLVPKNQNGPLVRASKPSGLVWRNIWGKKVIDSYRGVVEAANNLIRACMDHERTKAQLEDLDDEIQTERLSRKIRLEEVKRRQEKAEIEHRRDMANLRKEVAEAERRSQEQPQGDKRKPDSDPKSRVDRIVRCRKEWEEMKVGLNKEGITDESPEWKMMENKYQDEIRRIRDT